MEIDYNNLVKYVVRVKVADNATGSGVIVNPSKNSKYAYVLTCKHVVRNANYSSVKIEHVDNSITKFSLKCCDSITVDVDQIYAKTDGVVILILEKNNQENKDHLTQIDKIGILNSSFKECVAIGYPAIHDNGKIEIYPCHYEREIEPHGYEIYSKKPLNVFGKKEQVSLEGLSGAGIFTKDRGGKEHLVGIQIQSKHPRNLVCIALWMIAEKINKCLQEHKLEPIELSGFSYFDTININPDDLNFGVLKKREFDVRISPKS